MTENPLVKINIDPPEKIAKLYGIGSKTALLIVEHRKVIGAFHGPDDLAQVKGISDDLAITLSPSIDWRLPQAQGAFKKRDWFGTIIFSVLIVATFRTIIVETFPNLSQALEFHYGWLSLWIDISLIATSIFVILFLIGYILFFLIRDEIKAKKWLKIGWIFGALWILSALSVGFGNATYYYFYAPNKWSDLISNQRALTAVILTFGAFLLVIPILLVLWSPKLRHSSILARSYDIGIMILTPVLAMAIWVFRSSFPLWILILFGFWGCLFAYLGFNMIHWRQSFFESATVDFSSPQEKDTNLLTWQSWINARLPNPEQQQALKDALDKTYPPSKFKTLVGYVVISSGGWLILTALGAVIQWLIEKGLNQLWP